MTQTELNNPGTNTMTNDARRRGTSPRHQQSHRIWPPDSLIKCQWVRRGENWKTWDDRYWSSVKSKQCDRKNADGECQLSAISQLYFRGVLQGNAEKPSANTWATINAYRIPSPWCLPWQPCYTYIGIASFSLWDWSQFVIQKQETILKGEQLTLLCVYLWLLPGVIPMW